MTHPTATELETAFVQAVQKHTGKPVTPTSALSSLDFDSLDAISMVMVLEEQFGVELDMEGSFRYDNTYTVRQFVGGLRVVQTQSST